MEQPVDGFTVDWDFVSDQAVWADVVALSLGMALLMWLLWIVYRTMQVPRLPVNRSEDRAPSANWTGVLRYVLTTPFMVVFWMLVLMLLLATAAQSRTAPEIIVAATAVVGGSRLLAHLNKEMAHELAKSIPIIILGFILVGGGFTGTERMAEIIDGFFTAYGGQLDTYLAALTVFDFVITAMWFVLIRWRWLRRRRRERLGEPSESLFGRIGTRLRSIGYTDSEAGSQPDPETTKAP